MAQELLRYKETASQTGGPYVHIGLTPNFAEIEGVFPEDLGKTMVNTKTKGERITVTGQVFDGTGAPIRDCLVEIWQADAAGLYNSPSDTRGDADPNFTGFGRCPSNQDTGVFSFETIKPGQVPFINGALMAPHITFWIVARGINLGLHTRMYFSDEAEANANDPILSRIEHKVRMETLIGQRTGNEVRFDIRLQGDGETIFFDI